MAPSHFDITGARPPRAHRSVGRWCLALLALVLAVAVSGCEDPRRPQHGGDEPATLVVSETWVNSNQGTDTSDRISSLQRAISELRKETGTGWVGRQDDVTGYLGQLSGGSWPGEPAAFMDSYGAALFGVDAAALRLGDPDTTTVEGMVSVRATQAVGEVPVLDGTLLFTSRAGSVAGADRLTEARGRVFPGLRVGTEPQIGRKAAVRAAEEFSSGEAEGPPRLVVLPDGPGLLAWEVTILAESDAGFETGNYYIDALTGALITVRPVSAHLDAPVPWAGALATGPQRTGTPDARAAAEPDPNSVEVSGVDPLGNPLTTHGLRTATGIELVDTTTQAWDQSKRRGGIWTYDASRVTDDKQLPGELVTSPDTTIRDPEAIAAHAYTKNVLDYYAGLGRNSWDGAGGSAVSSIHYGKSDYCNAFFSSGLNPPQMVYGQPCARGGARSASYVGIDITGHEITHGVTASTADLIYVGQSGALNESFSDYFGNIIGNLVNGTDSVAFGEELCDGITEQSSWCHENPDASRSTRYMLNGTDFDDYLRILNPGLRLRLLKLATQDQGGVHYNSAIWNNALWSIRTRLAQIDNMPGNESPLARAFDKAVYGALATRLGPTAGFVDARAAVEQVIVDSGLDAVVLRVAREVFDTSKICTGCPTIGELAGDPLVTSPQAKMHPTVSGDLVAWLDLSGDEVFGSTGSIRVGGPGPSLGPSRGIVEVALAGEAVVVIDGNLQVIRDDGSGQPQVLQAVSDDIGVFTRGLSGSDAGAAWAPTVDSLAFVDPAGAVSRTTLPGLAGDTVISTGTGGGTVAAGTDGGKVFVWQPGGDARQVGSMSGAVATVAPYGGNVLAIDDEQHARLFTADGRSLEVSNKATVLGAAMSGEYAVWPEGKGPALSDVVPGGRSGYPETDLYLLSLATGKIYDLIPAGGQQGFPALSGRRLVWQDAAFGGNDILTGVLPGGL